MHRKQRNATAGGREFWTRAQTTTPIPEALWEHIQADAHYNVDLRMSMLPSTECVHALTGTLLNHEPQTGNRGQQKIWTMENKGKEGGRRFFYINTLQVPNSQGNITIHYLTGEAPRFKKVRTDNPAWQDWVGKVPFFMTDYYHAPEQTTQEKINRVAPLGPQEIPFIIRVAYQRKPFFADKPLCARYGL
ncbi:hypothetical protein EXS73_02185 [Candidatus Pacearchaeota archaeon]|nr:hypothetical protein [Candidatus Pacearchaeota archaeon]